MTCDELVALVRDQGPKAISRMRWLDELVDVEGAAEFTGLTAGTIRSLVGQGIRKRAAGHTGYSWPEPDKVIARRRAWKLRTIVLARAAMPGRGAGRAPFHPKYPPAVKQRALLMVRGGLSAAAAARKLGLNEHTVSSWVTADRKRIRGNDGQAASG